MNSIWILCAFALRLRRGQAIPASIFFRECWRDKVSHRAQVYHQPYRFRADGASCDGLVPTPQQLSRLDSVAEENALRIHRAAWYPRGAMPSNQNPALDGKPREHTNERNPQYPSTLSQIWARSREFPPRDAPLPGPSGSLTGPYKSNGCIRSAPSAKTSLCSFT